MQNFKDKKYITNIGLTLIYTASENNKYKLNIYGITIQGNLM